MKATCAGRWVQGMAGNIIHAIATTNAIISGLIVIEACKLLSGQVEKTRDTFCVQHPSARGKMLVPVEPQPPNAKCFVCSQVSFRAASHPIRPTPVYHVHAVESIVHHSRQALALHLGAHRREPTEIP
jgi:hypothetical protein